MFDFISYTLAVYASVEEARQAINSGKLLLSEP